MRFAHPKGETGAVMVMVAFWLPLLLIFASFAVDAAHFWDFSRNLQNRADGAALAAGVAYGNTCFQSAPAQAQLDAIGHAAQQYSGPPVGTPDANLPYTYASSSPYQNQPNLASSAGNFHLVLNASTSWDHGGVNFEKGNFCSTSYEDPARAATDVWVTQAQVPLFLPMLGFHPNISAHARVELQGIQSETGVRPIAVGDASYIPCVTANFLNNDGNVIASEKLTQQYAKDANGNSIPTGMWDSTKDAKSITMPSGNPVTVQLFLNNCVSGNPSGTYYNYFDANGNNKPLGLVYINNWGSPASPATAPEIAAGGVTLLGGGTPQCDGYFQSSSGSCSVDVDAHVAFPAPGSGVSYFVRAVDAGGNTGCAPAGGKSCTSVDLHQVSATDWQSAVASGGTGPFTFGSDSGPHNIDIWTAQLGGSVGGKTCNTTGSAWATSNQNCWIELGIQQRAFSGINGTNLCSAPAYDTGPMQWITVGQEDAQGNIIASSGANAFSGGASPRLFIATSIQGLANSQSNSSAICLRVAEQQSHNTGLIICPPQTSGGTTSDIQGIVNGCDPLQINTRLQPDGSLACSPTITPHDCVTNDTGQSSPILQGFDQLICTNGKNPPDNWPNVTTTDPRALVFIITAPVDFTTQNGTTQNPTIPIRNFAIFYVTGWSTGQGGVKGCSNNAPPPPGAGNGELWGYWTSLAVPSGQGTGNGQGCITTEFGNCIAVLTR